MLHLLFDTFIKMVCLNAKNTLLYILETQCIIGTGIFI